MEYINKTIGKYAITRKIGEGGMASVYEGIHEKLGTKVAIKILSPMLARNPQLRQRFENEANFMASLTHSHITRVLDIEEQDETLAIVMELLEGEDLDDRVKRAGPLSNAEVKVIFTQVLNAFEYAHSKGIVHRDIKPANIFIDKNNQVKILDFGIAKIFGTGNEMTQTGTQMGTPVYMSPEQVKGEKSIDHRSDIYALGITLYFILTGKAPYESAEESSFEIFTKIVNEPIPHLANNSFYDAIIQKAVSKDRNERYQTVDEFIDALNEVEGSTAKSTQNKTVEDKVAENSVLSEKTIIEKQSKLEVGNSVVTPNNVNQNRWLILAIIGVLLCDCFRHLMFLSFWDGESFNNYLPLVIVLIILLLFPNKRIMQITLISFVYYWLFNLFYHEQILYNSYFLVIISAIIFSIYSRTKIAFLLLVIIGLIVNYLMYTDFTFFINDSDYRSHYDGLPSQPLSLFFISIYLSSIVIFFFKRVWFLKYILIVTSLTSLVLVFRFFSNFFKIIDNHRNEIEFFWEVEYYNNYVMIFLMLPLITLASSIIGDSSENKSITTK
jgi:serine/threonine protein kinase